MLCGKRTRHSMPRNAKKAGLMKMQEGHMEDDKVAC